MQIKIRNYSSSGTTNVQVVDPNGEVLQNLGLDADQEVTVVAVTAHGIEDLQVSPVTAASGPGGEAERRDRP
jgi:hypothetical protein